ncbi:hypothetical protein [Yoonia sp. BS5-3]|uniref:Uncharacterized protein n=1 Tax=Yoonia phaeophyticola TaxID=3137369 RepID=A0ABZ2V078_9RHOB
MVQVLRFLLLVGLMALPVASAAQSNDRSVMRMVCFDSDQTASGQSTGGWTAIITQMNNEQYPATTFIPDEQGQYAEKFPMFENIIFFMFVFEETTGLSAATDARSLAEELLASGSAPVPVLAEGNRVGSLFDMSWGGSSTFQYDSADQSKNIYSDVDQSEQRVPVCQPPFVYVAPSGNG